MLGVFLYCTWKSTYNYYNKIVFITEMRLSQLPKVSTRKRELHVSRGSHSSCGPSHGAQSPSTPPPGHQPGTPMLPSGPCSNHRSFPKPAQESLHTGPSGLCLCHSTGLITRLNVSPTLKFLVTLGDCFISGARELWGQTQCASQAPGRAQDPPWGAQAAGQRGAQESIRSPGL